MIDTDKDPMGKAIADYYKNGIAARLRVFSPDFDEDEIPVETLFRTYDDMPSLEQKALQMAQGHILDVGAGAGCHSLALQQMGKHSTAIDISKLSVETMKARGVKDVKLMDFWLVEDKYDTILMLMNGIGIVGNTKSLPRLFAHIEKILNPGGQLIVDSTDIIYIFENADGTISLPNCDGYYGELEYRMQYKQTKGQAFPWLYIDFDTLAKQAEANGFQALLIEQNEDNQYLARITRK